MRKIIISLIILLLLNANINAQVTNEILKRVEQHRKALISLKAEVQIIEAISQIDYTDSLDNALCIDKSELTELIDETKFIRYMEVFPKTLYFLPVNKREFYLRLDSREPSKEVFLIKKDAYALYQPKINQITLGKTTETDVGNIFSLFNTSKRNLTSNFRIILLNNKRINDEEVWHIRLIPKKNSKYHSIEVWIDANGMINQIRAYLNNGDRKTIRLFNLTKNNKNFDVSIFNLQIPKGVRIIK